jgi:hypothetical protein
MIKDYKKYFKSVLNEEMGGLDITRNPDDVKFSDDLPPHMRDQFNVPDDITNGDVGFEEKNIERDVQELNSVISKVKSIAGELQSLSETLTQLERSFKGISSIAEDVAKAFAATEAIATNLSVYSIKLPAQKEKDRKEQEKQAAKSQSDQQG